MNANDLSTFKEQVLNMNEEEFRMFLKEKAEEILDIAADRVLGEIADKVMGEEDFPTASSGGLVVLVRKEMGVLWLMGCI